MNNIYSILSSIKEQNHQKMNKTNKEVVLQSILAGLFIGIGGTAAIRVFNKFSSTDGLGSIMSTFVFTIGFVLIITLGVQLFTSNNLMTLNILETKKGTKKVLKNWSLVWFGNLIGTFLIALLLVLAKAYNVIELDYISHLVEKKVHLSFSSALLLGIGCNMIIVLTVMLVNATNDYLGKVVVAIFGVMIFLLCGFEHVVANMYYVSLGVLLDLSTVGEALLHNLLPVTIGNILGGGVIIPILFHFTYK